MASSAAPLAAAASVDGEREIFLVDRLVGPVRQDLLQRGIQLVAQIGVGLAHGDADAGTKIFAVRQPFAGELAVLAAFPPYEVKGYGFAGQHGVETSRRSVLIGLIHRLVEP